MSNTLLHKKLHKYGLDSDIPPDWLREGVRKMVGGITGLNRYSDWKTLLDAAEKKLKELETKTHPSVTNKKDISCLNVSMGILRRMVRLNSMPI